MSHLETWKSNARSYGLLNYGNMSSFAASLHQFWLLWPNNTHHKKMAHKNTEKKKQLQTKDTVQTSKFVLNDIYESARPHEVNELFPITRAPECYWKSANEPPIFFWELAIKITGKRKMKSIEKNVLRKVIASIGGGCKDDSTYELFGLMESYKHLSRSKFWNEDLSPTFFDGMWKTSENKFCLPKLLKKTYRVQNTWSGEHLGIKRDDHDNRRRISYHWFIDLPPDNIYAFFFMINTEMSAENAIWISPYNQHHRSSSSGTRDSKWIGWFSSSTALQKCSLWLRHRFQLSHCGLNNID